MTISVSLYRYMLICGHLPKSLAQGVHLRLSGAESLIGAYRLSWDHDTACDRGSSCLASLLPDRAWFTIYSYQSPIIRLFRSEKYTAWVNHTQLPCQTTLSTSWYPCRPQSPHPTTPRMLSPLYARRLPRTMAR